MPPSVRTVTELRGLGLVRVGGPDGRDRPVRWVAVSELEDPTPFLDGGELLLSTGMRLPADAPEQLDAYVGRLVDAGVAALGLGVGLTHERVPQGLVDAADARGLPLLEVPGPTAFIAVSKAVSALLGVEEYEGISRSFEAQRDLTRAALAPDGTAAVAARLAKGVDGWVLVLDPSGRPLHAVPAPSGALAGVDLAAWPPAHRADLADLRRRGLLASSSLADAAGQVSLHPLGARGRVRGFLAVGAATPLDRNRQSVVAVAVSLLSIATEAGGPGSTAAPDVRAAALRLLLAGARAEDIPLDALGWRWLAESPLRVVVVRGDAAARADVVHRLEAADPADPADPAVPGPSGAPSGSGLPPLAVDGGGELLVVLADFGDPISLDVGPVAAGGSSPVELAELALGRTQALAALAGAHGPGLHWYGQLADAGMLGALDPEAARGVAAALLAPLEGRKGDLIDSLAAWLARHGQWDTAAADLGVHRHTLRYRMKRVEELLGRSLDDADLRAELWLALRVRRASTG